MPAWAGLALLWAAVPGCGRGQDSGRGASPVSLEPREPPPLVERSARLSSGRTITGVLFDLGFSTSEAYAVVDAMRPVANPRRVRAGVVFSLKSEPAGGAPVILSAQLDADRTLVWIPWATAGPVAAAGNGSVGAAGPAEQLGAERLWIARIDSTAARHDTLVAQAVIRENLFEAEWMSGAGPLDRRSSIEVALGLEAVYGWQVDFWRDLREGDEIAVLAAVQIRPDGSYRRFSVLAAELTNRGRTLAAVRFVMGEVPRTEYFDEAGEALRGQFLRSPLEVSRITSAFNPSRYHPILRQVRPHRGVDYGAPRGTPVRATGAGTVVRAGNWRGYGLMVELRHPRNMRTRYAHLSRLGTGIGVGTVVEQGDVIGHVGDSGLATAPHLHYEFLRGGVHVDPSRLDLPRAEPVPDSLKAAFRADALPMLARLRYALRQMSGRFSWRRVQD